MTDPQLKTIKRDDPPKNSSRRRARPSSSRGEPMHDHEEERIWRGNEEEEAR